MNQQPTEPTRDVRPEEGDSGEVAPKVEDTKGQGSLFLGGRNKVGVEYQPGERWSNSVVDFGSQEHTPED